MGIGGDSGAGAGDEAAQFSPDDGSVVREPHLAHSGAASPRDGSFLAWVFRVLRTLNRAVAAEISKDAARGAGFLCLPVLMAVGAAAYFALPFEPGALPLALYVAVLTLATYLSRNRPTTVLILGAFLVLALGLGAAKLETWRAATSMVGSDVTTNITGRLVRMEQQASGRVRLTIDLLETKRPHLYYPPERVRLSARSVPPSLQPGDGVSGLVRLMSPSGPVRPGTYDFSFASYFAGRGAVGFFMSGPEYTELGETLPLTARPARWLESLREALAERIRSRMTGPEGEVAVAIITGFRAGIPQEINEWLRRAGLAHILAISGLHMALVAVTVMFMLRALSGLFPGFSSGVPVKKYAAAAALAMCTLYLFISGAAVAAQRSYIMLAVMLAALIFDRAALTMRNVAIAALIIIVLTPHVVVGPSFQMSFAATASLVAAYAAWTSWRRERAPRGGVAVSETMTSRIIRTILLFFAGVAATSVIAGLATTLYGIWHFQRVAPLSLAANLTAMPVVTIFVMPSAVLAMLAIPFGLDGFFLNILGYAIRTVIAAAQWFSDRSPIDAVGLIPLSALLSLTFALVILVVSTTRLRLLALPFAVVGVVLMMTRQLPDVLITEDARLVGMRGGGGILAVNRTRPNGFTMGDWTRALKVVSVAKPDSAESRPISANISETAFSCGAGLCLARHESGAIVAHAENTAAAAAVCETATLIVLEDAVVQNPCSQGSATVVTKRNLARNGSAAVVFSRDDFSDLKPDFTFATHEPWRPWHAHRAWSRAARGLESN